MKDGEAQEAARVKVMDDEQKATTTSIAAYREQTRQIEATAAATAGGTKAVRRRIEEEQILQWVQRGGNEQEARRAIEERRRADDSARRVASYGEQMRQIQENTTRGMQEALTKFFENIFTDGLKSFQSLFDAVYQLFLRLVAQMLAVAVMDRVRKMLQPTAAAVVPMGVSGVGGMGMPGALAAGGAAGGMAGLLSGLGAAGAGGVLGFGVGYASGNPLMGALGGAGSGALIGNMILPGWGAVIGGVMGFVAGLFGAAKKAREAADAMKASQKEFGLAMDAFRRTATGQVSSVADALRQNAKDVEDLLLQANKAYPGSKKERLRNELRGEISQLGEQNAQRIRDDFTKSLDREILSLKVGTGFQLQRLEAEDRYQQLLRDATAAGTDAAKVEEWRTLKLAELAAAEQAATEAFVNNMRLRQLKLAGGPENERAAVELQLSMQRATDLAQARELLKAGTITQQMFDDWVALLNGEVDKALKDYDKALARQAQAIKDDLAVRALEATGRSDEAARLRLEIQFTNELADVTDEATRADILRVQALERSALAAAQAAAAEQKRLDFQLGMRRRQAVAGGTGEDFDRQRQHETDLATARALDREADAETLKRFDGLRQALLATGMGADAADLMLRSMLAPMLRRNEALLAETEALEANARAQAAAAAAAKLASDAQADLTERYLRATGQQAKADEYAFKRKQEIEQKDYLDKFGKESALYKQLLLTQAAELAAFYAQQQQQGSQTASTKTAPPPIIEGPLIIQITFNGDVATTDTTQLAKDIAAKVAPEVDKALGYRLRSEQRRYGSALA
jgi:gas vesicle protein